LNVHEHPSISNLPTVFYTIISKKAIEKRAHRLKFANRKQILDKYNGMKAAKTSFDGMTISEIFHSDYKE